MDEIKVKTPPTRWEYCFHAQEMNWSRTNMRVLIDGECSAALRDLGRAGWEVVQAFPLDPTQAVNLSGDFKTTLLFVLKRPLG